MCVWVRDLERERKERKGVSSSHKTAEKHRQKTKATEER
jgi:hypothetical protein